MHKKIPIRFLQVALLFLLTFNGLVGDANRIAVKAHATRGYTIARTLDKSEKPESFHLIQGLYFQGNVDDPSLEEVSFEEVADQLALNLQRQNYVSESDPDKGDLLIMVHYGVTNLEESYAEITGYDPDNEFALDERDPEEVYDFDLTNKALPKFWAAAPSRRQALKQKYFKASMLGMEDVFSWNVSSYEAHILEELVREPRYFFVLTAFDLPLLKQGEKKVLWTTRYSVRTIGQPFDQAVKELNHVAGDYFGKNFKDLISKRATDESLVKMGEIEVIGEGDGESN